MYTSGAILYKTWYNIILKVIIELSFMLFHTWQFDRHTITDSHLYIDKVASRRIILMFYMFYNVIYL